MLQSLKQLAQTRCMKALSPKSAMLYTIDHTTEYRFTRPVFFEPHLLRFQPRTDGAQRVVRFDLTIDPAPAGTTHLLDAEGNLVTMVWFDGVHEHMTIRATSEVETLRENPFDYLITSTNGRLPIGYQPWEQAQLALARKRASVPVHSDPVRELAEKVREAAGSELVQFLARLGTTICERCQLVRRDTGTPMSAATLMEQRQGACRDFAVLFIDACRCVGLAARFVSGYQDAYRSPDKRDLHAWAEVYLPNAGWRGYDPTRGMAVANHHVAVAAATDPQNAAPVTATYRGDGVEAELHTEVSIESHAAEPAAY
jgi:transglutaminase-like putative cysteine protease